MGTRAHRLRVVASCLCFSETAVISLPQRIPCAPWILPFTALEPILLQKALPLPWSAGVEGQEKAWDK